MQPAAREAVVRAERAKDPYVALVRSGGSAGSAAR
jgi:hypothetical protein